MIRNAATAFCLGAVLFLTTYVLLAWFAPDADAAPMGAVVQVEPADREVAHLRTVYVERVSPAFVYVEYNSGAAQYVRPCRRPAMVSCVEPRTGTVRLDDGSTVPMARWVR